MLDKDNYPDEKSLKEIEQWDILKQGVQGLLDLVEENTHYGDWSFCIKGKHVIMVTRILPAINNGAILPGKIH